MVPEEVRPGAPAVEHRPTDPVEVLTNVSTAKNASAALDSYNPPQKLYKELKKKLAELRGDGGIVMCIVGVDGDAELRP